MMFPALLAVAFITMIKDPHEYTNLVDNPEYAEILKDARMTFRQRMAIAKQSDGGAVSGPCDQR